MAVVEDVAMEEAGLATFNVRFALSMDIWLNFYQRFNQQFQPNIPADFQTMNLHNFYNPFQPIGGSHFVPPIPNTWTRPNYQPRPALLPTPQQMSAPQAVPNAMLTNTGPAQSNSWFPDSGASFHVTNASQNIQQTTPFEGPDQIFIGNGEGLRIHSSGSSSFLSQFKPSTSLVLHNLLHVPSITKNLTSVGKFCLDNCLSSILICAMSNPRPLVKFCSNVV